LVNPNLNLFGEENETNAFWDGFTASVALKRHHLNSLRLYNLLIERGVCREQARGVLPQGLYTEYYGTVNLNNLLKFVELRTHEGAQWEIQQVARACLKIARELWPVAINTYKGRNK
jgi:thymidylate synthase (FAD)